MNNFKDSKLAERNNNRLDLNIVMLLSDPHELLATYSVNIEQLFHKRAALTDELIDLSQRGA